MQTIEPAGIVRRPSPSPYTVSSSTGACKCSAVQLANDSDDGLVVVRPRYRCE